MTKQECAIKYITENYLDFDRLRHDVIADKLQIRLSSEEAISLSDKVAMMLSGEEIDYWRELTKHDINSIVCHAAQEYDANITSREVMTALQSDLIPDVHPLREYIQSLRPYTPEQPDWIDMVASQVTVRESGSKGEDTFGTSGTFRTSSPPSFWISRKSFHACSAMLFVRFSM